MTAQRHLSFLRPKDVNVRVWRYMSLAKFLWMLQNKSLFFCRSDQLGDPFEGHYTRANASAEDLFVKQHIANQTFGGGPEAEHKLREGYRMMLSVVHDDKTKTFVNCWHMNERESIAMWKLYAGHQEAICIQSRFSSLDNLLPDECFLGGVNYIDYETSMIDVTNSLNFIAHKRASFSHEREVRAVIWGDPSNKFKTVNDIGIQVPIDLTALIETIYVSPDATPSYEQTVADLARTYGINCPVNPSDANKPPAY